jgi:uncharacterized protein
MRTDNKKKTAGIALIALAVALGAYCAHAGDEDQGGPSVASAQGLPALRADAPQAPSERGLHDNRVQTALLRLETEARKGSFGAQLRLARIYSQGRETPRSDSKAFAYYRQIADQHADIDVSHPAAKFVAEAFRALAGYYRSGVPALGLAPDRAKASQLLQQGASYFQDPIAQFILGNMYLTGDGVAQNPKIGVHWLVNASRRRYAPAQAILGDLLWSGKGVRSSPGEGLALLVLAKDNAAPEDAAWIAALCEKAMLAANDAQVKVAERVLTKFEKLYRLRAGGALQIVRPGQPAPETLKSQEGVPSEEELRGAGALLGLFGGDVAPTAEDGAPTEMDDFPGKSSPGISAPGVGPAVAPGVTPHGMLSGFAVQWSGGMPPEKSEDEPRSLAR